MLPLAMSVGAAGLMAPPLDARQHEEFFLTATQSLLGIALLVRLWFSVWSAISLAGLFLVQLLLAFVYRNDAVRVSASLTAIGWVYLALAVLVFLTGLPALLRMLCGAFSLSVKRNCRRRCKSALNFYEKSFRFQRAG